MPLMANTLGCYTPWIGQEDNTSLLERVSGRQAKTDKVGQTDQAPLEPTPKYEHK